eukprot:2687014-Pyramimonas_sp.AAC.1
MRSSKPQLLAAEEMGIQHSFVSFGALAGDGRNEYFDEAKGANVWDYYFEPVSVSGDPAASPGSAPPERLVEFDVGALWCVRPSSVRPSDRL